MGRMTLASTQFHRFDNDDGDNSDDDGGDADDTDCDHGHEFMTRACGGLSRHWPVLAMETSPAPQFLVSIYEVYEK